MPGVFISHSKIDRAAAFALAERLKEKGYDCFLDFESIRGGADWERQIYDALRQSFVVLLYASPEACKSQWVFAEISIARFQGVPILPLIMRSCELWPHIATTQYIDFRTHPSSAYAVLWESLDDFGVSRGASIYPANCSPYRGLESLQEEDAAVFFGRDRELSEAIDALRPSGRQRRFLAVVGPSGIGKSSFVRAGLLPALRRGRIPGSNRWLYVPPFMPGETPFQNFADALCSIDKNFSSVGDIARRLQKDGGMVDVVRTVRAHSGALNAQVVIIIDQLEEFERRTPKSDADVFLKSLTEAIHAPGTPLIVISTLRSDFLSECLQYPALAPLLSSGILMFGAMDRAALGEAIRGPARIGGMEFETGLVEQIVEETQGGDALPLMADALRQLWELGARRSPMRISSQDYAAIGGVHNGLSKRAQELYDSLEESARSLLREAFVQLADVNERGDFTRRRLFRDHIPRGAASTIDRFIDARLLIASGDGSAEGRRGDRWVEVSHEALLRNWPLLREWLEEDSSRLRLRRQIEIDAREWQNHGRAEDYLWRSRRLAAARELMNQEQWPEGDLRRLFLSSAQLHERVGLERESEQLANRVIADYRSDPELGILLAIAAIETYVWTPRAELALNTTLNASHIRAVLRHEEPVGSAAFSSDGARIITLSGATACIWDGRVGDLLYTLRHQGHVRAATFSPNCAYILTASEDCTAVIWDAESGRLLHTLRGHEEIVSSASFNRSGTHVITASMDMTAKVWVVGTIEPLLTLEGHTEGVWSAAFSYYGRHIVSRTRHTVGLWDAETGALLKNLHPHDDEEEILCAGFTSHDIACCVTASRDDTACVWNVQTGELLQTLRGHEGSVFRAVFDEFGSRVVTASEDGTARIWKVETGELLCILRKYENAAWEEYQEPAFGAAFGENWGDEKIVTTSRSNLPQVWDVKWCRLLTTLYGHEDTVFDAKFDCDCKRIVTSSYDKTARVWDITPGHLLMTIRVHWKGIGSGTFSPDGNQILTTGDAGQAWIFNATSGELLSIFEGHEDSVYSGVFSRDGLRVLTASEDNTARIWDAESGQLLSTFRGHENSVSSAEFSPDGTRVLTASRDYTVRIWGTESAQLLQTLRGHEEAVFAASFSPDGTRIVTASRDQTARIWDAESGELLQTFHGHEELVSSAAFSPDGACIVTASNDRTACLWDAKSGKLLKTLRGHEKEVSSAAFSPDGARIVTASDDYSARVWHVGSGQLLNVLHSHENWVRSAEFSPDGARIITTSEDGKARIWVSLTQTDLTEFASTHTFRNLTLDERRRYGLAGSS